VRKNCQVILTISKYYSDKTVDEYHKIITEYCKIIRRGNIEGLFKKV